MRELVVLGTASQAPTRERNHNGYLLRMDDIGILFDPGEGTQRQMLHAGVRSSQVTHIAITHQHGDHCLGLPGVLQRMALDQRRDPVVLLHPESAGPYLDMLTGVGLFDEQVAVERVPIPPAGAVQDLGSGRALHAVPLRHRVPTVGYRVQEPVQRRFDSDALAREGLEGPVVGQLHRDGVVHHGGRTVRLEQVSTLVDGQAVAFVMDTTVCDGALQLLADVDLAVVEATFLDGDEDLAERFMHLTAGQAGRLAADAGARRLVLTHFSQRYDDMTAHAAMAGAHHPDVVVVADLDVVPLPPRPQPPPVNRGAP